MLIVKAPEKYLNEPDIILKAGQYIAEYGKRHLIVGGHHAIYSIAKHLFSRLK